MARSTGGFLDRFSIFGELWAFMKVRKKWWLGPIVLTMLLLSVTDRPDRRLRGRALHLRALLRSIRLAA